MMTIYVNNLTPWEIRAPRTGRQHFFLQNLSAASIFYEEGKPPGGGDALTGQPNGIELQAGQSLSMNYNTDDVPQGSIWISGATAAPTLQRVVYREKLT
jgi:hypothetical protein